MTSAATCFLPRGAVAVAIAILVAGCRADPASPPRTATIGDSPAPTAPPSPAPSPTLGPYAITGTVQEGGRPIPGVNVNAFVIENGGGFGYSWWWAHGPLRADSAGRYQISGLPGSTRVWLVAFQDGYVQQCAAVVLAIRGDTTVDIPLVSAAAVALSPGSPSGLRSVSGSIKLVTSDGRQPAAGAFVDFEPIPDFPAATTRADGAGRFALCGLPANDTVWLGAASGPHVAYAAVPPGQSEGVEIVLP